MSPQGSRECGVHIQELYQNWIPPYLLCEGCVPGAPDETKMQQKSGLLCCW